MRTGRFLTKWLLVVLGMAIGAEFPRDGAKPVYGGPPDAAAATKADEEDLGFEAGEPGKAVAAWSVPVPGWKAEMSEEYAGQGKRSAKLFLPGKSDAPFGNLMRSFDGNKYRGRHVSLSARIKVVGEGRGQMWLRVDRKGRKMGAFDNMDNRPILAGDWTDAEIEADIEADAKLLNIGFMSTGGSATLYIDAVRLKTTAVDTPEDPTEMGFEAGKPGKRVWSWFLPTTGWKAEFSEEQADQGKRSAKLHLPGQSDAPFGNLMRRFDCEEYRGRRVRLSARIKVVGEGRAQMWLGVDREGEKMGAFDSMDDRPILAGDWTDTAIEADIEPDAATLHVGFKAFGGATVYIDSVKLKTKTDSAPVGTGAVGKKP